MRDARRIATTVLYLLGIAMVLVAVDRLAGHWSMLLFLGAYFVGAAMLNARNGKG